MGLSAAERTLEGRRVSGVALEPDHILRKETAAYERGQRLRRQVIGAVPHLCIERARLVTQSYRETEREHILVRRMKAFDRILRGMTVTILDEELIVGHQASVQRSAPLFPEFAVEWIRDEFDVFETRPQDRFVVPPEIKREFLAEIYPYWKGKTLSDRVHSYLTEEIRLQRFVGGVFNVSGHEDNGLGHVALDYRKVLEKGLSGIKAEIEEKLGGLALWKPGAYGKKLFYEACLGMCDSAIVFARRYAKKAGKMAVAAADPRAGDVRSPGATKTGARVRGSHKPVPGASDTRPPDTRRRDELLRIAGICERVPEFPARTFHEALQSFWFLQLLPQIYDNGVSISPGRFDQYMFPYYAADIAEGRLTKVEAQELLEALWVKFTEPIKIYRAADAAFHAGYPMGQNLCVGGIDPGGLDATNDLSYRCLEAHSHMLLMQPNFSARLHMGTPHEFLMRVCEAIKLGNGMPQIVNDEAVIPALTTIGLPLEEARDYVPVGCVETAPPNVWGRLNGGYVNLPKIVELALNDGVCRLTGERVGPETGNPREFKSFDEVLQAFGAQLQYSMERLVTWDNLIDMAHAEYMPTPFTSVMVGDCIEKGRDVTEGGARHNYTAPYGVGIANAGNSLLAVKRTVFDEGRVSMGELLDALDSDYEGREDLRQFLVEKVPKYGNEAPDADLMAKLVADMFIESMQGYETYRGGPFVGSFIPVASFVALGMSTGATPDGRRARERLADGISPSAGTDHCGPTAVFKSVCTIDHRRIPNGVIFNQKIHPAALATAEGMRKFAELIRTYIRMGGIHVQFNIVSADLLRDAQKNPETHRGLVVRVAGYSAFFHEIHRDVQDSIIARTEQLL